MQSAAEHIWQAVLADCAAHDRATSRLSGQSPWAQRLAHFSVEVLPEIDSTNTELMRRAHAGRTEPTLLVALQQSAGRGRLGRQWASAQGDSLTFSLGLALAPQDWQGLSLAVGLALAQALHDDIAIKWPNDLWWQGRKLAGILVETAPIDLGTAAQGHTAPRYCVVGVGINIRAPAAQGLRTSPAGLQEIPPSPRSAQGVQVTAAQALMRVAPALLQAVLRFEAQGFAPLQAAYNARDALRGLPVRVEQAQTPIEGTARGVDRVGALLVHTAQGVQKISSSEVSIRPLLPALE